MTANQVAALRLQEESRSHQEQEAQKRKELAHDEKVLAETNRHNRYQEKLGVAQTIVSGIGALAGAASGTGSIMRGAGSLKQAALSRRR